MGLGHPTPRVVRLVCAPEKRAHSGLSPGEGGANSPFELSYESANGPGDSSRRIREDSERGRPLPSCSFRPLLRREISLRTTDRKIAERRPREWVANLHRVDHEKERMTFADLIATFMATNRGKSKSTQTTHRCIIKKLKRSWRFGIDIEVRDIRPSYLTNVWPFTRLGSATAATIASLAASGRCSTSQ